MPPLCDQLSQLSLNIASDLIIRPGGIFRLRFYIRDGITPKFPGEEFRDKFFVVLGIDDDKNLIGFLFVNTNDHKDYGPAYNDLQKKILKSDYSFLDHDSYIDCSELQKMKIERFSDALSRGTCDVLTQNDLDIVRALLTENHSVKELRKYNIEI